MAYGLKACRALPTRPLATWAAVTVALLIMVAPFAEATSVRDGLTLPNGSTQTSLGKSIRVFDAPVEIHVFDVPQPLFATARYLAAQYPVQSDNTIHPSRALLSGLVADEHWLFHLQAAGPVHTTGSLSVLSIASAAPWLFRAVNAREDGIKGKDVPTWLPNEARLRWQIEHAGQGRTGNVLQQIWTSSLPVAVVWPAIRRGLQQARWKVDALGQTAGQWRRDESSLYVTIVDHRGGSGIVMQHSEDMKP